MSMDQGMLMKIGNFSNNLEHQVETINYFESLKSSDTGWQNCVQFLSQGENLASEIQFFCLQVIEHFVKTNYVHSSMEHQNVLKEFLLRWPVTQARPLRAFIGNKIAQIISLIFVQDYPNRWPNIFENLLNQLDSGGELFASMYLRILLAIDTEIADRDISRTPQQLQRNNVIKDAMREGVVVNLAESWYKILNIYKVKNPELVNQCLQIIGKYILWMDINLVANDRFVSVLVSNLALPELQESTGDCIHDIMLKGMEPLAKTKLVESFYEVLNHAGIWSQYQSNESLASSLARIINAMGCQLIDSYNKLTKTDDKQSEACLYLLRVIHVKVPLAIEFLANVDDDTSATVIDFLRDYLHLLKQLSLEESQNKYQQMLLEVLTRKFQYDDSYNFTRERENEANFQEYRKQLKVLVENLAQLNKQKTIEHVRNVVNIAVHNWKILPFQDSEVALLLFYYLGEAIPSSGSQMFSTQEEKASPIQEIMLEIVESDINKHSHQSVVLQYFEIIVRYEKFFISHPDYISKILHSFLSENGLFHCDRRVRSRCSYLFCRFMKCMRSQISVQQTNDIIQAIQPLLAIVPTKFQGNDPLMSSDDQLYLYEVVGIIIITGERSNEKSELMKKVLEPLLSTCELLKSQLSIETDPEKLDQLTGCIVQTIAVTGRVSKAFSNQHTMKLYHCVPIFLNALNVFISCVEISSGASQVNLQNAVRQYLHRMVVCLEDELLPYIPVASQALLKSCDCKTIQEYLPLINQVIAKFKKEVIPFLNQIFAPMIQSVFQALAEPIEANDQTASRDRQILQRQYFSFIATIVTNNVTEVFSADVNAQIMEQVMHSVIQGSVNFPDPVAQKSCFSIMKKFVEMWGDGNGPNGFIDFMYSNIVPACFAAPCKAEFDVNDAQTLLALNEIGGCLKCIFDKRKTEFLKYLETYLPTLSLPGSVIQEFLQALQSNSKEFRSYLKNFTLHTKNVWTQPKI